MKAHKLCLVALLSCLSLRACPSFPPLSVNTCLSLCPPLSVPTCLSLCPPLSVPTCLSPLPVPYVSSSCLFPTWLPLSCYLRGSLLPDPTCLFHTCPHVIAPSCLACFLSSPLLPVLPSKSLLDCPSLLTCPLMLVHLAWLLLPVLSYLFYPSCMSPLASPSFFLL